MSFFLKRGGPKKRGRGPKKAVDKVKKPKFDEEISSDEDEVERHPLADVSDEDDFEDAHAKAYRESKNFLEKLKEDNKPRKPEVQDSDEEEDADYDAISHRLKQDALEKTVKFHRRVADTVVVDEEKTIVYRPHRFSPVSVAISNNGRYIVSCSKDGSIVKYDQKTKKIVGKLAPQKKNPDKTLHKGQIKCVAISGDDRYIASGGDDTLIRVYQLSNLKHVKNLRGHRGPITSLAFRTGTNELYSASTDKAIRSWNLEQMGFVEVLYGHSDPITQIDMLNKPKLVSAGGTARTIHLFKIEHSSQLVFNGMVDAVSVDCVAMINEDHYVSGQMNGSIYVWSVFKKKPVCLVRDAHGTDEKTGETRWITSIAARPYSDLVVSGSSDGVLKLWKVGEDYKTLTLVDTFEIAGFVNSIKFSEDGRTLAIAVGQEHKNGRWFKVPEAKNSIVLLRLQYEADGPDAKMAFESGDEVGASSDEESEEEDEKLPKARRNSNGKAEENGVEEDSGAEVDVESEEELIEEEDSDEN
uniref:WD_REPEATS_REGION domain-containing protein n=1 Tax=Bursaphelenchus xylophilus TaxID=6326 RepID=A0A1I7SCT6_BURXY